MAAAMSEPAQDLTRPATRAVRTEAGWRIVNMIWDNERDGVSLAETNPG